MRKSHSNQLRMDCVSINEIPLNFECRDEIVPVLAGLKHLYSQVELRDQLLELIGKDINAKTRTDTGREGFDYWQILVLGIVRLGCNLNYDRLQDLCENHRALRGILGVGDWDCTHFGWRRIRDTLCLVGPQTLEQINEKIVAHGQVVHGDGRRSVRADSFVIETNIHYPTESGLIWDAMRKLIPVSKQLAGSLGMAGWRQTKHQLDAIKRQTREIARLSASRSATVKAGINPAYGVLLERVGFLLDRVRTLQNAAQKQTLTKQQQKWFKRVNHWYELTSKVVDTAFRRTQLGETVPNSDKIFSIFEPHTQLYRRGKAGEPNQFGRMVMVFEDAAGFISHYYLMKRDELDAEVVVEQTRIAQRKHRGEIEDASFDRGYFSEDNQTALEKIVYRPCLPPGHRNQYSKWLDDASHELLYSHQRHSGVESSIGALQSGNGLKRCRDRTEEGLQRFIGWAVMGRNVHTLGRTLIAREHAKCEAARSKREQAA